MQELSMTEVDEISGGTKTGAALTLTATLGGIAIGVATGGVIGVIAIGAAAIGGLAYAYDEVSNMAGSSGGGNPAGLHPPPVAAR